MIHEMLDPDKSIKQKAKIFGLPKSAICEKMKMETVGLFVYDVHCPYEDLESIEIMKDYVLTNHPKLDVIVFGGDIMDCYQVSRWKKDPNRPKLNEEIEYTVRFLKKFMKPFNKVKYRYYLKGNHEDRLEQFLYNNAPELVGLKGLSIQDQLELKSLNIHYIDNQKLKVDTGKFFSIGRLNILHGHELGICPSTNPARRYLMEAWDNIIVGHTHKIDNDYTKSISGKVYGAWSVGCLCGQYPQYMPQNRWLQGFAIVKWDGDGDFTVTNHTIMNGKVL